jgi:EmrB/QacA subfamily drug resistance transporter
MATTTPDRRTSGWALPLGVLIVGTFMSVLDTSIVNVAIPYMMTALSASSADIEWVVTAYTLALGCVVPLSVWLGLRLGQTRLYMLSMLGFAIASALCGLAPNLSTMIIFRVIQAIPGGVLPVVTLTMLYQIVPRDKIGAAMGIYGLGVVVAPAVGPTLGGYLVEYIDWRLIFYINVPIGIIGTLAAFAIFPRIHPTSWPRLDIWGFVTIAYGLFAMLLAFSKGGSSDAWDWMGYRVLALFITSALSLALFVVIELEVDHPLIDLRVFKTAAYGLSLVLLAVAMTGLFSTLFFLPQFLQDIQGMQALDAGLVLVPSAAVLLVLMPIAGRIYDAIGPKIPVTVGLALMAYGSYLLAQLTPDTPRSDIELWTSIRNLGTGLAMMPIITAGLSALPPVLTGSGTGMNNVTQRVVSSVAVAVFGSLGTAQAAALLASRGSLLATGADALPRVAQAQAQTQAQANGPSALLGIYQQLQADITTQTYDNSFYVVAVLSAIGAVIAALFMRSTKRHTGTHPVDM